MTEAPSGMNKIDRQMVATFIADRLRAVLPDARAQWNDGQPIRSAIIDDLLPDWLTHQVSAAFPPLNTMMAKSTLRERKHVAAQMDRHHPLLEEIVFDFQDSRILALVADITGLKGMEPDAELYAGGISAMAKGAYLRPHLDNSHHVDRERYRVLNLLFYTTADWQEDHGGSLQLWDEGPCGHARTIWSRFNRLVLMATDRHSWHSVNEVVGDGIRQCVSNYYFSKIPPEEQPYFHATSFRAEHGKGLSDLVMRVDNGLRTTILKLTGDALYRNPHRYERADTEREER